MAKGLSDEAIDQLYQLGLDEFTAARNALAKESGDPSIKRLEKPSLAAWAVNQLYWRERRVFDEVIKTSIQVRSAHRNMLAGRSADIKAAEVFHAEAMRRAKGAIRSMLEASGNTASDAVMTPVTETLDALPTTDAPGRLTRPLRRTGFEALQGVTVSTVKAQPSVARSKAEPSSSAKAAEDEQKVAMAKERLRFADAAEREAEAAVERAKRTLDRATHARERIEGELAEAVTAEKAAARAVASSASAHARARAERERLSNTVRR